MTVKAPAFTLIACLTFLLSSCDSRKAERQAQLDQLDQEIAELKSELASLPQRVTYSEYSAIAPEVNRDSELAKELEAEFQKKSATLKEKKLQLGEELEKLENFKNEHPLSE